MVSAGDGVENKKSQLLMNVDNFIVNQRKKPIHWE
jgi:hypothetical protein